jgi:hypothetical protein
MLDEIDWGSLTHAYGPATDTPTHLAALTSANPDARHAALDHLDTAVLHQGFPESATAPATRVIAQLLAEGEVAPEIRGALIEFLGWVAEATKEAAETAYFADLGAPLQQAIEDSYPVVVSFLDNADPLLRKRAGTAAVSHVRTPALAYQRTVLAARLHTWANDPSEERAYWVRQLSELDDHTEQYLSDPDNDLRVCAALAPSLAGNATATNIIIDALARGADHGIANPDLYTLGELIDAAIDRIDDFELIAAPAQTIIRHEDWTGFDATWGPLLLAAFSTVYNDKTKLSAAQRDILAAMVANPRMWDHQNGSLSLVFRRAGLPFDRQACARIAEQSWKDT